MSCCRPAACYPAPCWSSSPYSSRWSIGSPSRYSSDCYVQPTFWNCYDSSYDYYSYPRTYTRVCSTPAADVAAGLAGGAIGLGFLALIAAACV
jgi:hypothetical protein